MIENLGNFLNIDHSFHIDMPEIRQYSHSLTITWKTAYVLVFSFLYVAVVFVYLFYQHIRNINLTQPLYLHLEGLFVMTSLLLSDLPIEVLYGIFAHLSSESLFHLFSTCKKLCIFVSRSLFCDQYRPPDIACETITWFKY